MPSKPVVVATNPLHYVYYRQNHDMTVIASERGMLRDCADLLGFTSSISFYDVANTPEKLVAADTNNGVAYVSWRPIDTERSVLGNEYDVTHPLERKTIIRERLPATLFPPFATVAAQKVSDLSFDKLTKQLSTASLVIQIDDSTGGKGTFFISNEADFLKLRPSLSAAGQPLVVSRRIIGTARALQCLLIDGQLHMVPWWHRDLLGVEGVYNPHTESTRYCGAVLENIPVEYLSACQDLATEVAATLNSQHYYGVFGIDIVVEESTGRIYLIEVNPRFTAVSHLYATAMHAAGYGDDFLTVYLRGLVEPVPPAMPDFATPRSLPSAYYYLKLQNLSGKSVVLNEACQLGVYNQAGAWQRLGWGADSLQTADETVIIPEAAQGVTRRPGERVFSIIGTGDPITDDGHLQPTVSHKIQDFSQTFLSAAYHSAHAKMR